MRVKVRGQEPFLKKPQQFNKLPDLSATTMMVLKHDENERRGNKRRHQSAPAEAIMEVSKIKAIRLGMRWIPLFWVVCVLNVLVSWAAATVVISQPNIIWQRQLNTTTTTTISTKRSQTPRRGNGVVLEEDSFVVWLTTNSGTVHIVRDGVESIYVPPTMSNRETHCNSSISLYQDENGIHYAVYAVVDMPYFNQDQITSRIIALSPTGDLRWMATVDGKAVGTPQIGALGRAVYVTHNTKSITSGAYTSGKLSVFRDDLLGIGGEVPLQGAGAFGFANKDAPFGPVTVDTSIPSEDQVFWTEAWDNGQASFGLLYQFSSTSYQVSALSRTPSSSTVAPVVSTDGTAMYIGGRASTIYGWPHGHSFMARPKWSQTIDADGSFAIGSQPVLSSDGTRLYASSVGGTIACLDAITGNFLWQVRNQESGLAQLHLAVDDEDVLFSIGEHDGFITKYNALNGRVISQFSCFNVTQNVFCLNSVEADFAVSQDGRKLFYADISGRLLALEFGDETLNPTVTPSPSTVFVQPPTTAPIAVTMSPQTLTPIAVTTSSQTVKPIDVTTSPSATLLIPATALPSNEFVLPPTIAPLPMSSPRAPKKSSGFPTSRRSGRTRSPIRPSAAYPFSEPPSFYPTSLLPGSLSPHPTEQLTSSSTKSPAINISYENLDSGEPKPSSVPFKPSSVHPSWQPTSQVGPVELDFLDVNFQNILANDDDAMDSTKKPPVETDYQHESTATPIPSFGMKQFAGTLAISLFFFLVVLFVGIFIARCLKSRYPEPMPMSTSRWREDKQQKEKLLRHVSYREVV